MIRIIANRRPDGSYGHAPMIYCDWCNKPIVVVNLAMVKWEESADSIPEADSVTFLHKGECDQKHSDRYATKKFAWDELRHFLGNIIHNVNREDHEKNNLWAYLVEAHCPNEEIAEVAKIADKISKNPDSRPPTLYSLWELL